MSSRQRDRDRRHGGDGEVRRRESDRRSPEHCSSDEYEDIGRAQPRRSEHRHRRSDARRDRSRSRDRNRSHRSQDQHADERRSRHRPHRAGRSEADEELEEGQCLPGEDDDDDYSDRREETPNNTIMLRGLGPDVMENDILAQVARHGLNVKEIRLMRHKETGASRGFAFVEFTSLPESVHWKRVTQGRLDLNGYSVTLHFSFSKELMPDGSAVMQKNDWTCYKCGVNNFKRRDVCFKCETGREESEANDTGDEISPTPTNCLILRNLASDTTSDQILTVVSSLTNAPIRSIRFPKDPVYNMPRGVCYIELHTTPEAIQLMALISSMDTSFLVHSAPLIINYARRSSASAAAASVSTSAASAALAAAQWTNQTASGSSAPVSDSLGYVSVNGVSYQKFPKPDPSNYQLESSSGFYYDSSTRLYYDPKSTYYFNSVTQQYLYWSDEYQTYLPPESVSVSPATAEDQKAEKTPDKVKKAKKIAKDMEKWAKSLNQKTISKPVTEQTGLPPLPVSPGLSSDIAEPEYPVKTIAEVEPEAVIDPAVVRREEECKLIDWSKLLCLLCKRQFTSKDQLAKHQQVSELHRSNLDTKMRSILSTEQMDVLSRRDGQYVDRAEERRKKWGNEEPVEPNPMKEKYLKEMSAEVAVLPEKPISGSNKGSRMLKAMGWQEGQGLGKKNKGRIDFVRVDSLPENAGLGSRSTAIMPGESYKDAVKRAMAQRYKELNDE